MPHAATKIQEVKTPGGLTAWLLPTDTLPMLSIEVSFRAGAVFEPAGKEGLAQFTAAMLDEGAGELDATRFKEELEAIGARFSAGADTLNLDVTLTTLTQHRDRAFELLELALNRPRFDDDALARVRGQLQAHLRRMAEDPGAVAGRLLRPTLFGANPWANDGEGTPATLAAMTTADLQGWHLANFTKSNATISVVGDISAAELAPLLDQIMGGLPQGAGRRGAELPMPTVGAPQHVTAALPVPQGTVLLGWQGIGRHDPDFPAFVVMNEIFGGGVLTSRLGLDVREKHGLVYGINAVNRPLPGGAHGTGMYLISFATDGAKVGKALGLVHENLMKMRTEPVTRQEFEDAQSYLIGSFPLRLDSNAKLLNMLSLMQNEGLGIDYLERWPAKLAAVRHEDLQRVAQRLLTPAAMSLVIVGAENAHAHRWPPQP